MRNLTERVCRKGPTIGLRRQLQEATADAHASIERVIAFDAAAWPLARYHEYLQRMHAFHRAVEPLLLRTSLPLGLALPARMKTAWLEQDLACFGVAPLDTRPDAPATLEADAAWGWMYVMEGSTLGARTLYPALVQRWSLAPERGARYLQGYGKATAAMWKAFTAALDAAPSQGIRPQAVAGAANDAFRALEALFRQA